MKFNFIIKILTTFIIALSYASYGQNKAVISGFVSDNKNKAVENASISVFGKPIATITDKNGNYSLHVSANENITLVYSFIGFKKTFKEINAKPLERIVIDIRLEPEIIEIDPYSVYADRIERGTITPIDPKNAGIIPCPSGSGIEELVKRTSLGVYSNNELSSQYSVRGGNFDENLVYVNDIEVYRPFLTRSGQQEGLSFVNPDLVDNVLFSSGGFDAKYGDKMSSVLDITYKKPITHGGSFSLSLLGITAHVEGASDNRRFTYLLGARQKSNQYMLNQLETQGEYKPSFTDVQTYITYQLSEKTELHFLGNYARNKYLVIPQSRETQFGTIKESYQLSVYFDGREVDKIETCFGALSLNWAPNLRLKLKFNTSCFTTTESEYFDIIGQYYIGRLETDFSKEDFGKVTENLGVGTHFSHARNNLDALVYNIEHKGAFSKKRNFWQWGIKYQTEIIYDKLKEWQMIDSSGYTLPRPHDSIGYTNSQIQDDNPLLLQDVINSDISLITQRYSAFLQDTWTWYIDSAKITFTAGIRGTWWNYNNQINISPRLTATIRPNWEEDVVFRLSSGVYNQPPFYKELRDFNGILNPELRAQTSYHIVAGADWNYISWGRPFKFITEIYYKYLDNLVPYEIDNVRIKYFADNIAKGYATGIDMKINGQFVEDIESWIGISFMKTKEDILNDEYYTYYNKDGEQIIQGYTFDNVVTDSIRHEPGYVPRPTDQLISFNLFFQDYLPKAPSYKMHLNFIYATGLPFGPPSHERYKDTLRAPSYFRVDIGFSKEIFSEKNITNRKKPFNLIKSMWISAEIFNLLGRLNTISYMWIKDVRNRQYAIPNELTRRLINIKLIAKF